MVLPGHRTRERREFLFEECARKPGLQMIAGPTGYDTVVKGVAGSLLVDGPLVIYDKLDGR